MTKTSKTVNDYIWLDFVRGLSALLVCACHLRASIFCDFSEVQESTVFIKLFYFLTGLGHQAVIIFFVLSGFFVGGAIVREKSQFFLKKYMIARLTRLWVVLIPALFLTLIIDRYLANIAPEVLNGKYFPTWNSGPQSIDNYSVSILTFLGNIFFLQTIFTPVFGSNAPLWSLANEFWYYIIFPMIAISLRFVRSQYSSLTKNIFGLAWILILLFLPKEISSAFVIWLTGFTCYLVTSNFNCAANKHQLLALCFSMSLFFCTLLYSKNLDWQMALNIPADYLIAFCFSILCFVIVKSPVVIKNDLLNIFFYKLSKGLSNISYSLYLSHFPLIMLLAAIGGTQKIDSQPNFVNLIYFLECFSFILICSFLLWFLFERQTQFVRSFINKLLKI